MGAQRPRMLPIDDSAVSGGFYGRTGTRGGALDVLWSRDRPAACFRCYPAGSSSTKVTIMVTLYSQA